MQYCSLDYFKQRARIFSVNIPDDATIANSLNGLLLGASERLDAECGWDFGVRTVTNKIFRSSNKEVVVDNDGYMYVVTRSPVINSITSVQYRTFPCDNSSGWCGIPVNTISIIQGRTDDDGNYVYWDNQSNCLLVNGWYYANRNDVIEVMATYNGGFTIVPPFLQELTFEVAWFLYNYTKDSTGSTTLNTRVLTKTLPTAAFPQSIRDAMLLFARPGGR